MKSFLLLQLHKELNPVYDVENRFIFLLLFSDDQPFRIDANFSVKLLCTYILWFLFWRHSVIITGGNHFFFQWVSNIYFVIFSSSSFFFFPFPHVGGDHISRDKSSKMCDILDWNIWEVFDTTSTRWSLREKKLGSSIIIRQGCWI